MTEPFRFLSREAFSALDGNAKLAYLTKAAKELARHQQALSEFHRAMKAEMAALRGRKLR